MTTPSSVPTMWVLSMDAFLSHWFARYDEARAYRDTDGGYLFPFGGHYFVTTAPAVRGAGPRPSGSGLAGYRFRLGSPGRSRGMEPFETPTRDRCVAETGNVEQIHGRLRRDLWS